ncbi:MAG TPA: CbiX/SirB N-terminal domain-containing protein [Rhodopila sp.]|uniref:CbiX/SirB N-terminal domain-containing protein n=1 Tax=Rhodopila sp. TaxID=2480087 RepID=UPI002B999955|nr:CbiX/SirB N-terminal domain-containing protein [Rhodopila sp.]HVY16534.1 CbiX/SirB N-terminal domain-containing protein [Rhodopila sp.]
MTEREALLLVAHGSSRYEDAARPLRRQVAALRAAEPGLQVEGGLLNGTPSVAESLARIAAGTVHVVPFFMEAGYFTKVAIPRALGDDPRVRVHEPVGVHPAMADVIDAQGRAGCAALGVAPASAAILVVGHGSVSAPGRALALQDHGRVLAAAGVFGQVATACLEETPFLADALRALADRPVIVIGFFAGEGMHVRDDVPNAVAAEQRHRGGAGPAVRFHDCVADHPSLPRIIRAQAGLGFASGEVRPGNLDPWEP